MVALLALVVLVGGLLVLVVTQVRAGAGDLSDEGMAAYDSLRQFLRTSPLKLTAGEFDQYVGQAGQALQDASQQILSGVAAIGSAAGHLVAGGLLTLFATIFLLIDGRGVWHWVVRLFPRAATVNVMVEYVASGRGKARRAGPATVHGAPPASA